MPYFTRARNYYYVVIYWGPYPQTPAALITTANPLV